MKSRFNLIGLLVFAFLFCFSFQALRAQEKILQPSDFFSNFPEISWESSAADAKKAIEKTGSRVVNRGNEVAWDGKFNKLDGSASLRFSDAGKLHEIFVQVYYSENGKETFESWLKKLTENYGKPKEEINEEVTSKFWEFKDGFSIELRLIKGDGENYYASSLHWVKSSK